MGTYHVLASCMLLYVSLTCNLMQNYYKKKYIKKTPVTTVSKCGINFSGWGGGGGGGAVAFPAPMVGICRCSGEIYNR